MGTDAAVDTARSFTRVNKWWASKVAPLLAAAYLALLITPVPVGEAVGRLVVLVVSACLLATSAYVINDWFDREVDRAIGKTSVTMRLGPATVVAVVLGLIAAGVAPWFVVEVPPVAWGALAAIVLLPLLYSAPPLRWKERGGLGLLADAGLAHVAPTTFSLAAFRAFDHLGEPEVAVAVFGTIFWSAMAGLRRIIGHELVDVAHDRAAGVTTWVDKVGEARARWIATWVVLPLEAGALGISLVGLWFIAPLPAALLTGIGVAMLYARAIGAWDAPLAAVPTDEDERAVLYLFLRFWPAVALAIGLAARDVGYLAVLVGHIALFWPVAWGELSGLAVSGAETLRLTWSGSWNWVRYSAWEWVAHTVPNWFRHSLWPPISGWFRYSLWEFVIHTAPNWFRYSLWEFVIHTVPNWFRYSLWEFVIHTAPNWFRYTVWEFVIHTAPNWFRWTVWEWLIHTAPNWFRYTVWEWVIHTLPNWFRYTAWVWISHTVPNWFRYRVPVYVGVVRRRIVTLLARMKRLLRSVVKGIDARVGGRISRLTRRSPGQVRSSSVTNDQEGSQHEA